MRHHLELLQCSQRRHQVRLLEDDADRRASQLRRRPPTQRSDVGAAFRRPEIDVPGIRTDQRRRHRQQAGLARTRRSGDRGDLAAVQSQRHVVQRRHPRLPIGKGQIDVLDVENCGAGCHGHRALPNAVSGSVVERNRSAKAAPSRPSPINATAGTTVVDASRTNGMASPISDPATAVSPIPTVTPAIRTMSA